MRSRGKKTAGLLLLLLSLLLLPAGAQSSSAALEVEESPRAVLRGLPFTVKLKNVGTEELKVSWSGDGLAFSSGEVVVAAGRSTSLSLQTAPDAARWSLRIDDGSGGGATTSGRAVPGWVSILPPLVAIGLALLTKQVLIALLAGVFAGAWLWTGGVFPAYTSTLDTFLVNALTSRDHVFIILFTVALGGMVSLISAIGGMQGLVERMAGAAKTPASAQMVTWLMGIAIFFDDYANTLLVGQTMKPVTDKQKISREKLAYLVDSTSAPVASIALISTWIGYEMSLIKDGLQGVGLDHNVYTVFLHSVEHRYYAIFALVFVFAVAYFHRDFGPMLKAERRAMREGNTDSGVSGGVADALPETTWGRSALDAVIPVGVVLFGTIAALFYTGFRELGAYPEEGSAVRNLGTLISAGNSFEALLWAAAAGGIVAALIAKLRYRVAVEQITDVYLKGVIHMVGACVVLVLAWAIGDVCEKLYTGPYLVELSRDFLSPRLLPTVTFLLSALVAFSTGTSWGTMAIVMPLAIRLAFELPREAAMGAEITEVLLISTIAGVLAGSTFGDHCSPISDTTIMSSLASGCDHIAHVRTQLPYALTTGTLAVVLGTVPAAYGISPWILNGLGVAACILIVRFVGKPVVERSPND